MNTWPQNSLLLVRYSFHGCEGVLCASNLTRETTSPATIKTAGLDGVEMVVVSNTAAQ